MTCAIVKTLEIDWIDTSDFMSPAVNTLPSRRHERDAE